MNIIAPPDEAAAKVVALWLLADETRHLEFKRVSGKMVGKALETVCAFANADGGLLVLGLADLKEYKGPSRLFGVEENAEAVDELVRKLRTDFLPPMGGVQMLRLPCALHNGPAKGQRGHLVVLQVQRSAQVHSLVAGGTYTRNDLIAANLRDFPQPPNLDAGEGVKMMFAEMALAKLYPPQYRENSDAAVESLTVVLLNHERPTAWNEVSDWLDRHGAIANADVVRIASVDTLRASKLLAGWREQGLLVPLPGRAKRNMAYAKPQAAELADPGALFSTAAENNPPESKNSN